MDDKDITEEWVLSKIKSFEDDEEPPYHFTVQGYDDGLTDQQLDKIFKILIKLQEEDNDLVMGIEELDFSGNSFNSIPDSLITFLNNMPETAEMVVLNFSECTLSSQVLGVLANLKEHDSVDYVDFVFANPIDEEFFLQFIRAAMLAYIKMNPDAETMPKRPADVENFSAASFYYREAVSMLLHTIEQNISDDSQKEDAINAVLGFAKLSTYNKERLKVELQWDLIPRHPQPLLEPESDAKKPRRSLS